MKIIVLKFPYAKEFFCEIACYMAARLGYEIEGVVSFDLAEKENSYEGWPIYPLNEIGKLSWDVAIYGCEEKDFNEIRPRMIELGIGKSEQFKDIRWLLQQFMIKKYEDFADPAIQETIEYWKTHEISVFNQHIVTNTFDKVYFDATCDLPYIFFKTVGGTPRKMYFPKKYDFHVQGGNIFVKDLLTEQLPTSPHLYITDKHKVNPGDIVIDAGVGEGNFALKYVDICSKMYLFESAEKWQEPLRQTFKDYLYKVEIIPKFVSDNSGGALLRLMMLCLNCAAKIFSLKWTWKARNLRLCAARKKFLPITKSKRLCALITTPMT